MSKLLFELSAGISKHQALITVVHVNRKTHTCTASRQFQSIIGVHKLHYPTRIENQRTGFATGTVNSVYMTKKLLHNVKFDSDGFPFLTTNTYGVTRPIFISKDGDEVWLFVTTNDPSGSKLFPLPPDVSEVFWKYYLAGSPIGDTNFTNSLAYAWVKTYNASPLDINHTELQYANLIRQIGIEGLVALYVGSVLSLIDPTMTPVLSMFNVSNFARKSQSDWRKWSEHPNNFDSVAMSDFYNIISSWESYMSAENPIEQAAELVSDAEREHYKFMASIHRDAIRTKPDRLVMSESNWKYLIRTIERGKNLMIVGAKGTGKTQAVYHAAEATGRKLFKFNLGATQDARSSLIGNTHFDKQIGTYVVKSEFVHAIETPNAVILLDELSRANPEAWNIMMSVIDPGQRYLRMDESPDTPIVKVADGVAFVATANIGPEYTATRVMDMALVDRFSILEMERLTESETAGLLNTLYPKNGYANIALAALYGAILNESTIDNGKVTEALSMRVIIETADLMHDGFTLEEASEVSIYPYFANDGADSPRTFVKQCVQKFGSVSVYRDRIKGERNTSQAQQSEPIPQDPVAW